MAKAATRAEKVKETKELAMNIDTAVEVGMLKISNTQAMRVSIIRSRRRRYAAVTPFFRRRSNELWKPKASVWIPVEHAGEIAELLADADKKARETT